MTRLAMFNAAWVLMNKHASSGHWSPPVESGALKDGVSTVECELVTVGTVHTSVISRRPPTASLDA